MVGEGGCGVVEGDPWSLKNCKITCSSCFFLHVFLFFIFIFSKAAVSF